MSLNFKNSDSLVCLEFDVLNKKMLSKGHAYNNSTLNMCDYVEVIDHLQKIVEIFSFYPGAFIDYFGDYMIMTSADDNKLEKIYYWLNNTILFDIAEESWSDFLSIFNLSQKNINFLKLDTTYTILSYLGFNADGSTDNIGFSVSIDKFFDRNPQNEYSRYIGIENVIKTIGDMGNIPNLGLQYSTTNQSYFAIELFLENIEQLNNLYQLMYKNCVICEEEYKNFIDMNTSSDYKRYIIKFRWQNQNTFTTKLYLENIQNGFKNYFPDPLDKVPMLPYNGGNETD